MRSHSLVGCVVLILGAAALAETVPAANQDANYKALRSLGPTGEALELEGAVLQRESGTFTLSGTMCFTPPVQGKVTGAEFVGNGTFTLEPPLAVEKTSLSRLTKQPRMEENFAELVLRFTDGTYDELKKSPKAKPAAKGCPVGYWNDIANATRKNHMLRWNVSARILQDVYSLRPGGFFAAYISGKKYNSKEVFMVDPRGAEGVAPEEVKLQT
jgi:hypothetical protein